MVVGDLQAVVDAKSRKVSSVQCEAQRFSLWLSLAFLFVASAVPSLAFTKVFRDATIYRDEGEYLSVAATIWEYGTFGESADRPHAARPALYPILLAPFVGVLGMPPTVVFYLQALVVGATACFVFLTARRLAGNLAGWLSGLLLATYLPLTVRSSQFMTEVLSVFWIVVTLVTFDLLVTARSKQQRRVLAIILGAVCALAALTRAIAFPLLLVPAVWYFAASGFRARRWRAVAVPALLSFVLVYSPWVVRNYLAFDEPIVLTTQDESLADLPYYTAELVSDGDKLWAARTKYWKMLEEGKAPPPELRYFSPQYVQHCWQRFGIMMGFHRCLDLPFPFAGQRIGTMAPRWFTPFNWLWNPVMLLGVAVAFVTAVRQCNLRLLHTIALPFALIVLYSLVHAIPRYQIVSYAAWTIPAGVGLSVICQRVWRVVSRRGKQVERPGVGIESRAPVNDRS